VGFDGYIPTATPTPGDAGDAIASASALSYSGGTASATATATGGPGGNDEPGGNLQGASGNAEATATANNIAADAIAGANATSGGYAHVSVTSGPGGSSLSVGSGSGNTNNGTLTVSSSSPSSVSINGVTGTGTLVMGDGTHATTLQLAYNSGGSSQNGLIINTGSSLDIVNNHMFINYGSGSDPIAMIAGYIASGYNGGAWNGPGIISSAALTPTNGLLYGVGYADGADNVVAGLSSGQIEVMYTLLGDANLDGLVNAADFNALAANFNQGVSGADVSAGDVAALDAFAAANGLSLPTSNVPEPVSTCLLALGGIGILARRRRRAR